MSIRNLAIAALAAAAALVLAASASASVKHWGAYAFAHRTDVPTVVPNLENVTSIDASNVSSYVLESNGSVWGFGENTFGELGNDTLTSSFDDAVKAIFPTGVKIVSLGEAQDSAFAIDSTGQGWAWGRGSSGELCIGKPQNQVLEPVKVAGMTSALAVQGGEHHVLWLLKNGTVMSCGTNKNGQLGVGASVRKSDTPIAVPGLSGVSEISAGELSSCARTTSGAVYTWGGNYNGQAGIGTESPAVYLPTEITLPGPASQISCGGNLVGNGHDLAFVKGVVYGWGADAFGQVGDGQTVNKTLPVIATDLKALGLTHVVASGAYSLGLNAGGEVFAWGSDAGEALGTGKEESSPIPLLVDTGAVEISATAQNSLAR